MEFEKEFFYDEVRDGFYIPGIMKRLWAADLTVLSEVDKICKKYDIPYYAVGGTLLGAVRDGSFIPWDDDIDIMMLRKDYNRFVEVAVKELSEELLFDSMEISDDWDELKAVVGKTKIGFFPEVLRKYWEYPLKCTIDIFILDELAKTPEEEEYRKQVLEMFSLILLMLRKKGITKLFEEELKKLEDFFHIQFDREKPLKAQLYHVIDHIFQEFNGEGGDWLAIMPFYLAQGICKYPKSAFENGKRIPFCGMQIPIPGDYDTVLKAEFGDYHKKVKAGGGHDYPCIKKQKKELQTLLKGAWDPDYHFSEEDLVRPKIQNFRDMVLFMVESLMSSQKQFFEEYSRGDISSCLLRLSNMQEEAIAFGNSIEQKKGEGTNSVSILEEYCDSLYQVYRTLMELKELNKEGEERGEKNDRERRIEEICFLKDLSPSLQKELHRILKKPSYYLKKLRVALEKDFKRQVVFLPHSAKHFESLRPLVDALINTEDTECKIIPIPYYDKNGDGSPKEIHYEGENFPKEYEIIDYRSYDFAAELPESIVINSPYDEFNPVFSVDARFYSREIKKYTKKLVYIPWFVTDEINPKSEEDGKAFINMEYYVTVPGVFHSDLTIVQSEGMKKAYLAKIEEFAGKAIKKKMEKKISGAGSCLLGEKEGQGSKEVLECFRRFLVKK
ncbi:LicD family protein [Oribacterium parvum]|uniref:LicD family protein n=1 Tax=Oribacterium parvum TaxID=1501329 RepID=UPI0028DBB3C4|nr:LicD family protein [Oribacterium parvum]